MKTTMRRRTGAPPCPSAPVTTTPRPATATRRRGSSPSPAPTRRTKATRPASIQPPPQGTVPDLFHAIYDVRWSAFCWLYPFSVWIIVNISVNFVVFRELTRVRFAFNFGLGILVTPKYHKKQLLLICSDRRVKLQQFSLWGIYNCVDNF